MNKPSSDRASMPGIAIIGMAGRFPGANDTDEFWSNLRDGVASVSALSDEELLSAGRDPSEIGHTSFVKAAAVLSDIDLFDASFFGFNPREAEILDPQHRIFLECAHNALENAGYDYERCAERIGIFAGAGANSYFLFNLFENEEVRASLVGPQMLLYSNDKDFLCSRTSYKLNLKGPSVAVQTACSTSLVAVHLACQSLLSHESDIALAGGVSVTARQKAGYFHQEGGILSPDGCCRAFDAQAGGTIFGSGAGIVVLKRLQEALDDGDFIHAVIIGSAVNNDGSVKVGYTAPSIEGQVEVISEAQALAGVEPESITYVEAHGTGTGLGDPVEVAALTEAFGLAEEKRQYCALGSVKTNIGHLDTAAGAAGLIKTVLALEHKQIPPSLNFERPNPAIDFKRSPFFVNTALSEWKTNGFPRRAGVSSFGIGGTNAHVVLEEARPPRPDGPSRPWQLVLLSSRTSFALEAATKNLAGYLQPRHELNLADVAYTLQVGRRSFEHRRAVVCRSLEDAVQCLESLDPKRVLTASPEPGSRSVALMFPGQGSQYVNMGLELYHGEEEFRKQVDLCAELFAARIGFDIRQALYPPGGHSDDAARNLSQTSITQPALFSVEYAMAKVLMQWGLQPEALIGHSVGEYVAACLSGVISLEDATLMIARRAQFMHSLPGGAMLSVALSETQARGFLTDGLALAAVNGDSRCVIAGAVDAVDELDRRLRSDGVEFRRLMTSHAFHSPMMDPIVEPFRRVVGSIKLSPPRIPYISNVTGAFITAAQATDPGYWAAQLRQTVRFADGVKELIESGVGVLIEAGPGRTLSTLAGRISNARLRVTPLPTLLSSGALHSEVEHLLRTLGKLWLAGVDLDWRGLHQGRRRRRLPLPTYPFERKRYWVEPARKRRSLKAGDDQSERSSESQSGGATSMAAKQAELVVSPNPTASPRAPRSERVRSQLKAAFADLTGIDTEGLDVHATFFELGADSLLLVQASQLIEARFKVKVPFRRLFEDLMTLDALAEHIASESPDFGSDQDEEPRANPSAPAPAESTVDARETQAPSALEGAQCAFALPTGPRADDRVSRETPEPAGQIQAHRRVAAPAGPLITESMSQQGDMRIAQRSGTVDTRLAPSANGSLEKILGQQLEVMSRIMSDQIRALRDGAGTHGPEYGAPLAASPRHPEAPAYGYEASGVAPSAGAPATQPDTRAFRHSGTSHPNDRPEPYIPYKRLDVTPADGLSARQQEYLKSFIEQYGERTRKSKLLAESARQFLADSRLSMGFRLVLKELIYPIYCQRAAGPKVWDVDGNEYVDLAMGYGVHLFGNNPRFVVEALSEHLDQGLALAPQQEITGRTAELICELTGVERVNFCNSGTEAVGAAIRIARTITRRNKIAMFAGSYHGWADQTMARKSGSPGGLRAGPSAPGVLPETAGEVIVLDYGSPESLEILKAHGHELAAVLVEPVQSRRPDLQPREFLHELRELTSESGAALIFDEMITGFRLHLGGAQAWFGVTADIVTYGKILGGGMPIGVIAGKSLFMDAFDGGSWKYGDASHPQSEHTYFAGTFFRHPLVMFAAYAVLQHLKVQGPSLQENLNRRTSRMVETIGSSFDRESVPIRVVNCGSLFRFFPSRELKLPELFFWHLIRNGVFNWEGGNFFLSTAHSEEDVDRVIEAAMESATQMRSGGFLPDNGPSPSRKGPSLKATTRAPSSSASGREAATVSSPSEIAAGKAIGDLLRTPALPKERMQFGLYFFGNYRWELDGDKYDLLLESVRFADQHGLASVWLPERHFSPIGGISPNPSVLAAAIARETRRIRICAGSVVVPLHNPLRIAEEWSVVDNVSGGRTAVSFASGWHPNDFVFAPDSYANRRRIMLDGIETIRRLWRGGSIAVREGSGKEINVKVFPRPVQPELPFWLTGGSAQTIEDAGRLGAGFLTNLVDHSVDELAEKIAAYRNALAKNGFDPKSGHVTVLLHTFLGEDEEDVKKRVKQPFHEYLKAYFRLASNKVKSQGRYIDVNQLSEEDFHYILSNSYERYMREIVLIGTPDSCLPFVNKLIEIGVDEISCMIDLGVDTRSALESLGYLNVLRDRLGRPAAASLPVEASSDAAEIASARTADADSQVDRREPAAGLSLPLTDAQKQVWALALIGDEVSRGLHVSITLQLRGPLNLKAMRKAVRKLFERHEALRVTADPDGERQRVHPFTKCKLPVADFSYLRQDERQAELATWLASQAQQPFDLSSGPLARFALARVEPHYHLLVLTAHHFIVDGRSGSVLLSDLAALYSAECLGANDALPAPASYGEYVRSVVERQNGPESLADEEYWRQIFSDGFPSLELPLDRPHPKTPAYKGARVRMIFSPPLVADLDKLSSSRGCSLFMMALTGFYILLHQLTGQEDFVVGINVAQHQTAGNRNLVAFMVNPLALRGRVSTEMKFSDCLSLVKGRVLGAYEHQNIAVSAMNRKARTGRDGKNWNPVPVAFNLDRSAQDLNLSGLEVRAVTNSLDSGRLDVYLDITERMGELILDCDYNSEVLDEETIRSWLSHYRLLLEAIASGPERAVGELPGLSGGAGTEKTPDHPASGVVIGLTKYQLLIWAGQKLHPDTALSINAGYAIVPAAISVEHYRKAAQAFIDNCDALRTVIVEEDGAPKQKVLYKLKYEPEYLDFSRRADPRAELDAWACGRCREPLDLYRRLFDVALIKLSDMEYATYLNIHHVVSDAWSVTLILSAMSRYYELSLAGRLGEAEELPRFQDYVTDELEDAESPRSSKAEQFWKEKLSIELEPLKFYGKPPVRITTEVQRTSCKLSSERAGKLKAIARRADVFMMSEDVSLHHVFAAIVCAYLRHITASRHISLGAPFNNRRLRKETIGLLMQILPLRISVDEDDTFLSLIGKISSEHFKILRYHEYRIGNPIHRQAYDVEFNFINARNPRLFNDLPVEHKWLHPGHGTESLAIQVHDDLSDGFTCEFDFHCDVFDEEQRPFAVGHFIRVVDAIIESVEQNVDSISLVSEQERRLLLGFNRTEAPFQQGTGFTSLFEEQVEKTPDSVAIAGAGESLTYKRVNAGTGRLAQHLMDIGIGPETRVALLLRRGSDFLTAILAVFKAGGAFMPLDPEFPPERIARLFRQSGCAVVIAAEEFTPQLSRALEHLPLPEQPLALTIEDLLAREALPPNLQPLCSEHSLSYVIYTSGSTGLPKGAMIERAGMLNHLYSKITTLSLGKADVIAQSALQSTDVSVWQFLAVLLVGGRVHVVDDETVRDPLAQLELAAREGISILEIVPTQLRAMLDGMAILGNLRPNLAALKWLIVNGEELSPELCRRWLEIYPDVPLINAYGPTECSDDVMQHPVRQPPPPNEMKVPIGKPLANTRLYVLDKRMSLAPLGVPGELYIGGAGVGRGYLNDPERTAQSFLPEPFSGESDSRMYKTGDLVRRLPGGELDFISRLDHQVKVRGFRIELGEIEHVLSQHEAVVQAVAGVREEKPGDKRLVAWVVPTGERAPTAGELRVFVKEKLPDYSTPSAFVFVDSLPLTSNGKIDRKALPSPDSTRPGLEGDFVAPTTETEQMLAQIWAQVLGLESVGVNDNFFDLGGDSILIILIAAKANQAGLRISPMQMFERQTIAELAEVVGKGPALEAEQGEVTGPVPLTPIQHWFFELEIPNRDHFNQALMFELRESIDFALLQRAVKQLLFHHDALRLCFKREGDEWRQFNAAFGGEAPVYNEDLSSLAEEDRAAAITARAAELQASMSLAHAPLLRVALFDLGAGAPGRLLFIAHHLVADGVSWRILLGDLQIAYQQLMRGEEVNLPPKTTSYKQWSERLARYSGSAELLREADYWVSLASKPSGGLPLDARGRNTKESTDRVSVWLDEEATRALLQDVLETFRVQINEVLLAALARALWRWTGARSHLVKLEAHGREPLFDDMDVSRTVGWFTSMFPVLLDAGEEGSPFSALESTRNQLRSVSNNGVAYGILRYLGADSAIAEQLGSLPAPEVEFNYLGQFDNMVSEETFFKPAKESSGPTTVREGARDCILDVSTLVLNRQLHVDIIYSTNLHERRTIEKLAGSYIEELGSFIDHSRSTQAGSYESDENEFDWSSEELDEIVSAIDKTAMGADRA